MTSSVTITGGPASGYENSPISSIKNAPSLIVRAVRKALGVDKKLFRKDLKEAKAMLKALLSKYPRPSPIQEVCWPALASCTLDVIGIAQTGSGKTLAFLAPLLVKCFLKNKMSLAKQGNSKANGSGIGMLVVAPTRELAIQIHQVALGASSHVSSICLYGGVSREDQIRQLRSLNPTIAVGTPGRLADLAQTGHLNSLGDSAIFHTWVLDEADRMLEMGFEPELRVLSDLMSSCSKKEGKRLSRQTIMFSATWPKEVQTVARRYQVSGIPAVCFQITSSSSISADDRNNSQPECGFEENGPKVASTVSQGVEVLPSTDYGLKDRRLLALLRKYHKDPKYKIIIFVLYKKEIAHVESVLRRNGFGSSLATLHGDMMQSAREAALCDFRTSHQSQKNILLATDVAARGLDVLGVIAVLNYTFPLTIEDYVHRVGRTGRAGASGNAHTFFTSDEKHLAPGLVALLRNSSATIPEDLLNLALTSSSKKKVHSEYGAFYREASECKQAKHFKFSEEQYEEP